MLRVRKTSGYVQVVQNYKNIRGNWRYFVVKSFGRSDNPENVKAADRFVKEYSRYIEAPDSPIPCGIVDEELWAGLREVVRFAPIPHPAAPLLMIRDLLAVMATTFAKARGDIKEYIRITQPQMSEEERKRFLSWLQRYDDREDDLLKILSLKWRFI